METHELEMPMGEDQKTGPRTTEEIRAALQGGIARSSAAPGADLEGGERLTAASFRAEDSAKALRRKLRAEGISVEIRKCRRPTSFEIVIDVADRGAAAPIVDAFRAAHGNPPPRATNHHDLLILSTFASCVLGLTVSYQTTLGAAVPVVLAMTGAGALIGLTADQVVLQAKRNQPRFGIVELLLLTAIIGALLMISRQIPLWLGVT